MSMRDDDWDAWTADADDLHGLEPFRVPDTIDRADVIDRADAAHEYHWQHLPTHRDLAWQRWIDERDNKRGAS